MNKKKKTPWITKRQAKGIIYAADFADWIGTPLNTAVTIHWALAGGPGLGNWRERQKRLFENLRHWLSRRGEEWIAVWTVEAGPCGKDVHLHLVMHLPSEIEENELREYLLEQLNVEDARVLDVQPIWSQVKNGWDVAGLKGWLRYILKGVDPEHYDTFGISKKHRNTQGMVFGKRCGMTQNISPAARN